MSEEKSKITDSGIVPHTQPIYQTSVYNYPDLDSIDAYYDGLLSGSFIYGRYGLPNTNELAIQIAKLENCEAGLVGPSGMGSIFVSLLTASKEKKSILSSLEIYGETHALLKDLFPEFGIKVGFADSNDLSTFQEEILRRKPSLVFLETISNPKVRVCNIKNIAKTAHEVGSTVIVDNTVATPFVMRPSDLGADVVVHSGTKFLGGHHDITIGTISGKSEFISRAVEISRLIGMSAGPFDSWLAKRSLATWKLRVEKSSENALKLATFLQSAPHVSEVYYPGLSTHPDHDLASKTFKNGRYGGLLSFDLEGGIAMVNKFIHALSTITLTPSFGGVSTTISHPGKTSHRMLDPTEKKTVGITDSMVRVSVGVEDFDSIGSEFQRAISAL